MIFQISENNIANRVFLSGEISELEYLEKYNTNNDLISYDNALVPKVAFLKYIDNKIVEDIDRSKEFELHVFTQQALQILPKTDYLMLIDNPGNLTTEQIDLVIQYRKDLRNVNITGILPVCPDFLNSIINK